MKKRIAIFLTLAMLAALFVFPTTASAASQTDLYVSNSGDDSNDGLSAEAPKLTMTAAFSAAGALTGGVVIHLDDFTTSKTGNFTIPAHTNPITLTGTLKDAHTADWFFISGGPLTLKNLTIEAGTKNLFFLAGVNPFTVDEGVVTTLGKTAIYGVGSASTSITAGDVNITIKSGAFNDVAIFRAGSPNNINGNGRITVSGTAEINNLVVARNSWKTINNAEIVLEGGKVNRFAGHCDRTASTMLGESKTGVVGQFNLIVTPGFDYAGSFNLANTSTTIFGLSGSTVATSGATAVGVAEYYLVLDETIYDTVKNDTDKCQADSFDKIVKDAPALRTASLTLDGKIGLNFYVFVSSSFKAANPNGYAKLEGPEGETTVLLADAPVDANGNSKFTYAVAAKDMREDVTISFFDGNDQPLPLYDSAYNEIAGGSYTYTVGDYLAAVDGDASQSAEMKALAGALSDYNACAELLFGTGTPAAPSLGNMDLSSYKATLTGDLPAGVTLTGMTLLLESETTLRVYFKLADGAALPAVTVDGTDVSPVAKDGQYYIAIENIAAPDLGVAHSIAIGGCTVSASALSYSASVLANAAGNEPLCNTAKALANYYIAADAYFN